MIGLPSAMLALLVSGFWLEPVGSSSFLPARLLCYPEFMKKAIRDIPKGRGRPKTTGRGDLIAVRLHPPLLTKIDEWATANAVSRPEAIRMLCMRAIEAEG
jgi:hypothetical protein